MPYVEDEDDTLFSLRVRIRQLEAELGTHDLAVKTAARRMAELEVELKDIKLERDMLNQCVTQCLRCTERLNTIIADEAVIRSDRLRRR